MRRWPIVWVCGACLTAGLLLPVEQTQPLRPRLAAGELFVSAPDLRVLNEQLTGRLKNGASVAMDYHLALFAGNRTLARRRSYERFTFSYDLWEENYTVSTLRTPRAAATRMNAREAEKWCLDQLPMPVTGIGPEEPFWLRLEIKTARGKESGAWLSGEGVHLGRLLEALGSPGEKGPEQWRRDAGPFHLRDFPARGQTP